MVVFAIAAMGLWGCAQGPAGGPSAERMRALEAKVTKLEEDFRGAVAARDQLRKKLSATEDEKGQLAKQVDQLTLVDGDQVLLCTDGLSDMLPDTAIAEVLGQSRPSNGACQALVDLALEAGGKDNVTVVLGRYCFR